MFNVVEKTSTCHRSRIPYVVAEKIMTCRREEKKTENVKSLLTFLKILRIYLQATAITRTEI